ncbi:MAG: hypothetical protein ACREMA_09990 [Longimicrobiales bacterium]
MRMSLGGFSVAVAALLAAGCAEGASVKGAGTGRDSAGVTIVENSSEAWTPANAWRVAAEPVLAIGAADGPAEYQLFRIRRALRLADQTIVVANAGSSELRFYDVHGKHIRSAGGNGDGPGEYRAMSFMGRYGADSLVVWDVQLARGTVVAANGTYGRTITKPAALGDFTYFTDVFADGALLGFGAPGIQPERERKGVRRNDVVLFRLSTAGAVDTIGQFLFNDSYITKDNTLIDLPFGREGAFVVAGDLIHQGSGESFEIRSYSPQGKLTRITRSNKANAPLTRTTIDSMVEIRLSRMKDPGMRQMWQIFYQEVPFPKTLPAFADFLVDAHANLWVSDYHQPNALQTRWTVFDSAGRLLGEVQMPPGFSVHEIGVDYLLGSMRDEFDVERVLMFRLLKPGQS